MTAEFTGFSPEAIQFLVDLAANNERPWFQARKTDYERLLKEPLEALCADVAGEFVKRGVPLQSDPKRSPFRIYRDVRFSKDKSPYKTHIAANFPWRGDGADDAPTWGGGYFHLQPGEVYLGGGMWHPEPAWLAAWRDAVDRDPGRVHDAIDDPRFVKRFKDVHGDSFKRTPTGYAADHPEAALLKLKDVTFGLRLADAEVHSPKLPATIATAFADAVPVFRLLASIGR